jgi:hypothetical protein
MAAYGGEAGNGKALLAVLNFPFIGVGGALLAITEGEVQEEHPQQA